MIARILVDTGPLVAILSSRDQYHEVCVEQLRELSPPLLTCWPVITEVVWLLRDHPTAVQKLLGSFNGGFLHLLDFDEEAMPWIAAFLRRYQNIRSQLADAALVYLADREGIERVFTLDKRDFTLYRLRRNRRFQLFP